MIRYPYQAYCRSVTRAQSSPAVQAAAVVLIILVYFAGQYVTPHERGILRGLRDVAAGWICAAGIALLAAAVWSVRCARVTPPPVEPVPADAAAWAAIAPQATIVLAARAEIVQEIRRRSRWRSLPRRNRAFVAAALVSCAAASWLAWQFSPAGALAVMILAAVVVTVMQAARRFRVRNGGRSRC